MSNLKACPVETALSAQGLSQSVLGVAGQADPHPGAERLLDWLALSYNVHPTVHPEAQTLARVL